MKTHFKFILCFVGILSITACGSSDPDLPGSGGTGGDDETLVTLADVECVDFPFPASLR